MADPNAVRLWSIRWFVFIVRIALDVRTKAGQQIDRNHRHQQSETERFSALLLPLFWCPQERTKPQRLSNTGTRAQRPQPSRRLLRTRRASRGRGSPITFDPDREFDAHKFSETRKTAIELERVAGLPKCCRGVFVYPERRRRGEVEACAIFYVVEPVTGGNGDNPNPFGDLASAVATVLRSPKYETLPAHHFVALYRRSDSSRRIAD